MPASRWEPPVCQRSVQGRTWGTVDVGNSERNLSKRCIAKASYIAPPWRGLESSLVSASMLTTLTDLLNLIARCICPNCKLPQYGSSFVVIVHSFAAMVHNEDTTWNVDQIPRCLDVISIFAKLSSSWQFHPEKYQNSFLQQNLLCKNCNTS